MVIKAIKRRLSAKEGHDNSYKTAFFFFSPSQIFYIFLRFQILCYLTCIHALIVSASIWFHEFFSFLVSLGDVFDIMATIMSQVSTQVVTADNHQGVADLPVLPKSTKDFATTVL